MQIRNSIDDHHWPRVSELFEAVGWGKRPPELVAEAFGQSTFIRAAFEQDKLVGFGRTVDDGRYYGLIVDLVVDPDHQGQGVGTRLLRELRECLKGLLFLHTYGGARQRRVLHSSRLAATIFLFHLASGRRAGFSSQPGRLNYKWLADVMPTESGSRTPGTL